MGCLNCRQSDEPASYKMQPEKEEKEKDGIFSPTVAVRDPSEKVPPPAEPMSGEPRQMVKVLAQVVQLRGIVVTTEYEDGDEERDDPYVFWEAMIECPVHIILTCVQEGVVYEYKVFVVEQKLCPFTSCITEPGTDVRKTGEKFVEWRDIFAGKVYGLNFFTETEALRFLASCAPPTLTPKSTRMRTSSAPPYISSPPPHPLIDIDPFGVDLDEENDIVQYESDEDSEPSSI